MTSHAQLFIRLDTLQASIKETLQLIQRLATLQPSDLSSPNQDEAYPSSIRADLAAEIHDTLKQQEEDFELLQQDVEDVVVPAGGHDSRRNTRSGHHVSKREQERERESAELLARSARLSEDLRVSRNRFRRAQLQAKRNADLAEERERAAYIASLQAAADALAQSQSQSQDPSDEQLPDTRSPAEMRSALFANRRPASRTTHKQTQDEIVLDASADLTASLRRTNALLTAEVERSHFAQENLEASNAALKELNERYGSLDDLLSKSRGLLGTLVRSQKSDTWYLQTTLYILGATIAWLVFRRLFYGPLWWFVYLPFKLWYNMSLWVMTSIWGLAVTTQGKNGTSALVPNHQQQAVRVMPSATGRPVPMFERGEQGSGRRVYMPVGAGGQGAKVGTESLSQSGGGRGGSGSDTPMSDMIEKMMEASRAMADATASRVEEREVWATPDPESGTQHGQRDNMGQQDPAGQAAQQVQRGDGQVLPQRDEATQPRNPKKRMFEEPPAPPQQPPTQQQEQQRDEL